MSVCTFGVVTHGQLGKRPHPVLESTYRIGVGLDTSLIPTDATSYPSTDSYGGIFMCSRYPSELRWWLIHVGMSLWYVARLITYLDLASIFKIQKIWFRLQVESYISDWLFSESRLLASYVSRHKAMAYDIVRPSRFVNLVTFCAPWLHPMMEHRFSKALTKATVVAGVMGKPSSSVSFSQPCL